jgi:hypothetical protein
MSADSLADAIKPARITISVDPEVHELLLCLADKADRSVSRVAAIIIKAGLPWLVNESRREEGPLGMIPAFGYYLKIWRDWKKRDEEAEAAGARIIPFVARGH